VHKMNEKRVQLAQQRYEETREARDTFWVENAEVLERYQELCELNNMALKRLDQACRETKVSAGPMKVRIAQHPVYDVDYLENLFSTQPEVCKQLISVTKKVNRPYFEKLANQGCFTEETLGRAITRVEEKVQLIGAPKPTILQ